MPEWTKEQQENWARFIKKNPISIVPNKKETMPTSQELDREIMRKINRFMESRMNKTLVETLREAFAEGREKGRILAATKITNGTLTVKNEKTTEEKISTLKTAEDNIQGIIDSLNEAERALLYRTLYYGHEMRISRADEIVRKAYK